MQHNNQNEREKSEKEESRVSQTNVNGEASQMNECSMVWSKENGELIRELKDFRHNALNMMHGLKGYIELEDWEGLKTYFYSMLESVKPSETNLTRIERIENPVLRGLLTVKLKKATSIGVDFKLKIDESMLKNITYPISNRDLQLVQIISISLDNAIETASEANVKKVSLYLLKHDDVTNFIIENTFRDNPKKPLRAEVSSALSKEPNILYNTFVQHQIYVQEIQIRCVSR